MAKRTTLLLLALLAAFGAGYWMAEVPAIAAESGKVFELRTYTANPGKLEALNARFRDHTLRLFEKHGMENVGYWTPTDPETGKNTLIYMVAHQSAEAAKTSWAGFFGDPAWRNVKEESERDGGLVEKVESVYMSATDYSPMK